MRAALLALLLAGCREGTGSRGDSGAQLAVAAAPDAGWVLTPAKLDAWLAYQRAMLGLPAIERDDSGLRDAVLARARLEAVLRADAGLSEADVDRIEDVVGAIVAQRNIARITGVDALREFEKALADLKDAQRAQAEKAVVDLRARAQQTAALDDEKARYGEETVRVVLTREQEVTKTWDALVEARGGRR